MLALIDDNTTDRPLGILGDPGVNVFELNLALDERMDAVTDPTDAPSEASLRIYLGAAPGVGKTFAMLNEGRRRRERGADVVVGFVETHGRPRTAEQIGDLEVVPRRTRRAPRHDVRRRWTSTPSCAAGPTGARRRVRPHQRPRLAQREALAGRRRAARRRHRRHLDRQHPAPRVAQRRRRADHRHPPAGDGPRPRRAAPPTRSSSSTWRPRRCAAAGPRQRLRRREGRRRAGQLLPRRQPVGAPRAGAAVGRRPGRRLPPRLPRAARHHPPVGDARTCRGRPVRRARRPIT